MPPETNLEYSDDLMEGLELIWGKGFLSPGGLEEVTALLKGIAVEGQNVLDVGCGLGGPSCSLIEQHGAEHVTAIDIQEPIIRKAIELASARGLAELIDFRVVSPGPFPFDENSFDLLFSKDAIVHVDDKPAFFRECYRVLRKGGWLAVSDWFGGDPPYSSEMKAWLAREAEYLFYFSTLDETATALGSAGFEDVTSVDRNVWYKGYAKEELSRLTGPLRGQFVARFGEVETQDWIEGVEQRKVVVDQGHLRPGHLRGRKPKAP